MDFHESESTVRLVLEVILAVTNAVTLILARLEKQKLTRKLADKEHRIRAYEGEFERLDTPPPVVIPRGSDRRSTAHRD